MLIRPTIGTVFLLLITEPAWAEPICVACSAPDAVYPCALAHDGRLDRAANTPRAVEAVCLKVLKKTGQHKACRVVPSTTSGCSGTPREISAQDYFAALSDSDTPSTVEGLLPGAARTAQESLSKAGDAIKGSAQSTWGCLSSLFANCSSED